MNYGERKRITQWEITDIHTKAGNKCPVCDKVATSRYWDSYRKHWVYKHTRGVKGSHGKGIVTATTYHTADR